MPTDRHSQNEEWLEAARQFWKSRNSGMTSVRKVICQVLLEQEETFDAEVLLEKCRKTDTLISLSTVYRTLRHLVEAGLLLELEGIEDKHLYRLRRGCEHSDSTLVCTDCHAVFSMDDPCLALRESDRARRLGFTPKRLSLRMETSCNELKETGECSKRRD